MKKFTVLIFLYLTFCSISYSRPQYSILQSFGTKCQNCHINTQGGGIRNNPGWLSRKDISLISPKSIGLGNFFDFIGKSNTFIDDKITFGFDIRYQSARWPGPTDSNKIATKRDNMLMQATPYLAIRPFDWMELEGQYNVAYDLEENKRYIGQQPFTSSMYLRIAEDLPTLRIGKFQPTIGTKFDDHTYLVRQVGTEISRTPLIPDDYAEWGAQLEFEKLNWLGVTLGVFSSKYLSELQPVKNKNGTSTPIVDVNQPTTVIRVGIYPETKSCNTFFGGYYLFNSGGSVNDKGEFNNYFYIGNLFFNIGISDQFAIMTEYMRSYKHNARSTNNFLLEVNYQVMDPINVFVRGERANTEDKFTQKVYHNNQLVIGTHIFPLPFIDLLAEYRIYEREAIQDFSAQWAIQLHIFY